MTIIQDWDTDRVLHVRYLEGVSSHEYLESVLSFGGDPRFDLLKVIISDWSGYSSETSQVDIKEIEKTAAYTKAMSLTNPNIKLAMVLMNSSVEHRGAFASLFELLSDGIPWKVASFNTLDEAKVWLEIDN
ncbi:MAG: hypothetical protein ACI89U_002096 [Gammaproteobacteria bacterium]|jgi:hypothetical protein